MEGMLERYGGGEDVRSGSYYGDVSPNKNKANLAPAKHLCGNLAHSNVQGKTNPIPGKAGKPPFDIYLHIKSGWSV